MDLDPAAAGYLADPHPVFDGLRGRGPVRDPLGWSVLSYEGCNQAFLDRALVPGIDPLLEQLGHGALWGVPGHTLTDSEDAAHARLRRAVAPWFSARRIAQLRARTRALVDELLDDRADVEVMAELADLVPARLFCWMVGASEADARQLADWSKALLLVFTATAEMVEPVRRAKAELAEYTQALLAHKRAHPGDDVTSALVAAETLTEHDAHLVLDELLSASVDNTANTAGLAVHTLAADPLRWAAVHADPQVVTAAVEECGRFQPAIRHTVKFAVADTELEGRPIARGEFVTLRIAAAHRDPAVYPDPHTFDVHRRRPRPQLAFGAGRHYCLGSALGRMEVEEMVGGLTNRWPSATLGGSARLDVAGAGLVHELPLRCVA